MPTSTVYVTSLPTSSHSPRMLAGATPLELSRASLPSIQSVPNLERNRYLIDGTSTTRRNEMMPEQNR
jgi:hypothetical protein